MKQTVISIIKGSGVVARGEHRRNYSMAPLRQVLSIFAILVTVSSCNKGKENESIDIDKIIPYDPWCDMSDPGPGRRVIAARTIQAGLFGAQDKEIVHRFYYDDKGRIIKNTRYYSVKEGKVFETQVCNADYTYDDNGVTVKISTPAQEGKELTRIENIDGYYMYEDKQVQERLVYTGALNIPIYKYYEFESRINNDDKSFVLTYPFENDGYGEPTKMEVKVALNSLGRTEKEEMNIINRFGDPEWYYNAIVKWFDGDLQEVNYKIRETFEKTEEVTIKYTYTDIPNPDIGINLVDVLCHTYPVSYYLGNPSYFRSRHLPQSISDGRFFQYDYDEQGRLSDIIIAKSLSNGEYARSHWTLIYEESEVPEIELYSRIPIRQEAGIVKVSDDYSDYPTYYLEYTSYFDDGREETAKPFGFHTITSSPETYAIIDDKLVSTKSLSPVKGSSLKEMVKFSGFYDSFATGLDKLQGKILPIFDIGPYRIVFVIQVGNDPEWGNPVLVPYYDGKDILWVNIIEYIQDLMTINDGTIQKSLLSVDAVDNIQIGAKYSFGNYKVSFPSIVFSGADE